MIWISATSNAKIFLQHLRHNFVLKKFLIKTNTKNAQNRIHHYKMIQHVLFQIFSPKGGMQPHAKSIPSIYRMLQKYHIYITVRHPWSQAINIRTFLKPLLCFEELKLNCWKHRNTFDELHHYWSANKCLPIEAGDTAVCSHLLALSTVKKWHRRKLSYAVSCIRKSNKGMITFTCLCVYNIIYPRASCTCIITRGVGY